MRTFDHVVRSLRWPFLVALAFATIGSASAKWVVDQAYSNVMGNIQFVVLSQDGGPRCSGFSVLSVPDDGSSPSGESWGKYEFPQSLANAPRLLIATHGFEALSIVKPDIVVWNGFFQGGPGFIKLCDDVEFHYTGLPLDGVTALDAAGSHVPNVATNAAGLSASVTAEQAVSVAQDLQEGHTGSWYDPATNGQGFEVEVLGDYINFGTHVMVSWFTYDHSVVGGAERQRWYTLYGHLGPGGGAPAATLDIYKNVGGNLNAAPITASEKVGTATLSFAACDHGTLEYEFTDGSGRSGSVPITRMTQNVVCSNKAWERPAANADFALSGNWYDPATSGQGVTVEINPTSGAAFLAWYTYAPGGAGAGAAGQRWYTAQSPYIAGARTVPMTIYETTGGLFDASTPQPRTRAIGSATLAFQSCTEATLTYAFTGGSSAGAAGVIALRRLFGYCSI
jgi:hypothetical protein